MCHFGTVFFGELLFLADLIHFFFFQAEDGIRDIGVTGVQTCALPISFGSAAPVQRLAVATRANVPPFHVMDVLAAASERRRTHDDLIDLVAGQPSTPAPRPVREAARQALDGVLGYTVATGIPQLREAIAAHHRRRDGINVTAEDVVVTTGSSGGFLLAFVAAFDIGARVAIARPGYPCYRNVLAALGCEVVELDTGPGSRFQPSVAALEIGRAHV